MGTMCQCGELIVDLRDESACDACGVALHLGCSRGSPCCARACPANLCEGLFCGQCVEQHRHQVQVGDIVRFPALRNLFEQHEVTLENCSIFGTRNSSSDGEEWGYVALHIKTIKLAGLVLECEDAHISLADVRLVAVPESKRLRNKDMVDRLFDAQLEAARACMLPSLRGYVGWNGLVGPRCCLDLRNDQLGTQAAKLVSKFNAFPVPAEWPVRTLCWQPGRTLHLSLLGKLTISRGAAVSWTFVKRVYGLDWETLDAQ